MKLPCPEGTETGEGIFAGMEFWEALRALHVASLERVLHVEAKIK